MSAPEVVNAVTPGGPVGDADLPRVSVVILNFNGRHHLAGCFDSLRACDYPADRLEVVLVDNGSTDGSLGELARDHAWVRTIPNPRNTGFSAGCNQGAAAADRPGVLVFLNNDMRVEPDFLRELVAPVVRGECAAATGKMLSWDGKRMNSAGGGMNFHGIGIQRGYLKEPGPEHDVPLRTLFACGGAMAIDAAVFAESGGFDEEFFAYYEDVDLGWRLWVQGHEVHYTPRAVCYHHHSSTSRRFPIETVRLLQVRNPVLACFKNYDDENLRRVLAPVLALAVRRSFLLSGVADDTPYRIEAADLSGTGLLDRLLGRAREHLEATAPVRRAAVADLVGLNDLLGRFDHWSARRAEVQSRRRRPDAEILGLFRTPLWCVEDEPGYRELQTGLVRLFGLDSLFRDLDSGDPEPNR